MAELATMPIVLACCEHMKDAISWKIVEFQDDGFNVNGCCGGGCYVISGCRFCPFCGNPFRVEIGDSPETT